MYKSQFYLVFEYCDHDLAALLRNVKFSLSEMKKIMQQLFNGLFYIHKNNILHRDMKTANILVTKEGVLKLADFGLSRAIGKSNFIFIEFLNFLMKSRQPIKSIH
jgi:cyclin-dependent kinase 9